MKLRIKKYVIISIQLKFLRPIDRYAKCNLLDNREVEKNKYGTPLHQPCKWESQDNQSFELDGNQKALVLEGWVILGEFMNSSNSREILTGDAAIVLRIQPLSLEVHEPDLTSWLAVSHPIMVNR